MSNRTAVCRASGRRMIWVVFALALAIDGVAPLPLFAQGGEQYGRGWNNHWGGHDNRDHDRNRHHRRRYHYAQPVYAPPMIYFEPRQSPGIGIFFPLDFRR
ncbi:MAG: hypothetical protein HQL87_16165 [Magnetococcales bacterium]|nr:hypothetical protein [Magnetococcales bacterium]